MPSNSEDASARRVRTLILALLWSFPVFSGLAALQLGKSAGFDFLSYHYYNGYAALTHRLNFDILPAGRQTFFAPAADTLLYELVSHLPARLVGFVLGAVSGVEFRPRRGDCVARCPARPGGTCCPGCCRCCWRAPDFLGSAQFPGC